LSFAVKEKKSLNLGRKTRKYVATPGNISYNTSVYNTDLELTIQLIQKENIIIIQTESHNYV